MKRKYLIVTLLLLAAFIIRGQSWSSCAGGFENPPKALFADTISNKLYASGFGFMCDGMLANSIASWDGTKWDTLGHGQMGAYGEFLIRYKNKLYLQQGTYMYAWDFVTLQWDSVPGGKLGGNIQDAVIDNNNDLILVGDFNKIGSVTAHNIMRFDGTNFSPIGFPTSYYIRAVEIFQNEIYIGGNFGGDGAISKWDGSQWLDVDSGFVGGGPPEVTELRVYNNRLYAAGAFYGTKTQYIPSLAVWDGIKWNDVGGIKYDSFPWGVVYKMHLWNNKLLVVGTFDIAGDVAVNDMALWNDTSWCSMNTDPAGVWVSAIFQNKLYIGEHETLNGDSVHLLGYLNGGYNIGVCGSPIGIKEINLADRIKIYPNPTTSILNIVDEQNELQNATIEIKNSLGQIIYTCPFTSQINISDLSAGIYFLHIQSEHHLKAIKIIKN